MRSMSLNIPELSLRSRIIITFTLITIALLVLMSVLSYQTVKKIYLEQLSYQIDLYTHMIVANIDFKYLDFIVSGEDVSASREYYIKKLMKQKSQMEFIKAFIFSKNMDIVLETGHHDTATNPLTALLLNNVEIIKLMPGESVASEPFKGNDGLWYLWGFYRINDKFFLGIQESADRLAKVDELATIFLVIGIIALILTSFTGLLIAHTLARPVQRLVKFSEGLGAGNFNQKMPAGIHGEIGILAQALDKMRQDLQRFHAEREEMLAQIAHEIKNPLGGIELMAGLVKEDLKNKDLDISYMQKILEEINKLKSQINDYLNFSRPIQVKPTKVNVPKIIEEIRKMFADRFSNKNITLNFTSNREEIIFDPNHLKQILTNLVSNCINACPGENNILINLESDENSWKLSISDDGPGITEKDIYRIFDPFYTTSPNGTGLGLAICKKLCKENGSTISVKNNPDQGCTFIIYNNESKLLKPRGH